MNGIRSSQAIGTLFVMILATASAWAAYPDTELTASARQPAIYALGKLPGHEFSEGFGISADGRVAVGRSNAVTAVYEAFRWTQAEGMIGIGFLPGKTTSVSLDVSADGSVIVGGSYNTPNRAFRWTQATGMANLGVLPGHDFSVAIGVSADGSVVVGSSQRQYTIPYLSQAYRWTSAGGMVGLGYLPSPSTGWSEAKDVSADGSVVVGHTSSMQGRQAFRWTAGSGMVGLGELPGGAAWSRALGVSPDGRVVVGTSSSAAIPNGEAFVWTEETGIVGLGTLSSAGWPQSEAYAASADGSVVVGWSYDTTGHAFIWDRVHGMRNLWDVLTDECGLDLTGWDSFSSATGISHDGLTILGNGWGPAGYSEAFVAVLPEPASLSLLALGGLALVRRRRGKARKGNTRAELRAMKGIGFSGAIVIAALFVMVVVTAASASTSYGLGFTWNRWADWKPGTTDGSSAGNPCKDSAGNAVWSYEYITNVPDGSDLDTSDGVAPWYTLPSPGLMVWDGHTGASGSWGYQYDNAPFIFPGPAGIGHVPNNQSYNGDHFAIVPLVRWDNPSTVPIEVSLTSGPGFQGVINYWPAGTTVDLVIARTDASDGGSVHLLYSQTIVKTLAQGQHEYFALPALDIPNLALDPGDDIIFSIRARAATTGYTWYSVMFDDNVNITVVPEPATIGLLAVGGLALIRRRKKGMRGCPGPSARAGIPLRGRGVGISAGVVVLAVCLAGAVLPCAADDYITIGGKTYLRHEFRINTGGEQRPDISYAPNGDFVVAWDAGYTSVYARRFARDGQPLTAPIFIGSDYMAWYPSVASRSDGSFIVAYQHELADGREDIAARIVAPDGTYLTGTLNVNTYTDYNQIYPQVGVDGADRSLIVWQSQNQLGSDNEVVGRRLGADGQALEPEFIVNTTTAGGQAFPAVCVAPSGSATVGWYDSINGNTSARKQSYDANGAPVGGEVVVAGKSGMWTGNAGVATNNSGNTVIVWEEAPSGTNLGHVYFRRYDPLGQAIGDACEVTDRVYLTSTVPNVAMWPDGRFVVTWYEYGSPQSDCYARLYSPDGLPLDDVFVVNALTAGRQFSPYVAVNAAGDMAFVWIGADGSYVTLLTPEPATLGLLAVGGLAMLRRRRR